MNEVSIDLSAHQLQLLAINALFEQARRGVRGGEPCASALQQMLDLGARVAVDPRAARQHEMDDAQAALLYHALLS